jgi:tetratricopeptide (TPR) repeat protein
MQSNKTGSGDDRNIPDTTKSAIKVDGDALLQQGWQYYNAGNFDTAILTFQQALSLYKEAGNSNGEQMAIASLASTFGDLGDNARSIEYYKQVLLKAEEDKDNDLKGLSLRGLGACYQALEDLTKAEDYFRQGLIIAKQLPTRKLEVVLLNDIGNNYYKQMKQIKGNEESSVPTTIMRYSQGKNDDLLSQDRSSTAIRLFEEGVELYQKGLFEKSLEKQYQALAPSIAESDRETEIIIFNFIGTIYRQLNQYTQALECLQKALVLCRETGDHILEGTILNNIAIVYSYQAQYEKALEYYWQSLEVSQNTDNKALEGRSLQSIAMVYSSLKQTQQALDYLFKALNISREIEDHELERDILEKLGGLYHHLANQYRADEAVQFLQEGEQLSQIGKHTEALSKLREALAIFNAIIDKSESQIVDVPFNSSLLGKAMTALAIGDIYRDTKQYQQALEFYQEALIAKQIGEQSLEAMILSRIGDIYFQQGMYEKSLSFFQQTLTIRRNSHDKSGENNALAEIARIYFHLNKIDKALELYEQCLLLTRELQDRDGEGVLLNNLGTIYANQEQYQKAIDTFQQSLLIAREKKNAQGEASVLNNLGILYNKMGQKQQVQDFFQQALVTSQESQDQGQEQRASHGIEEQISGFAVSQERQLLTEGLEQIVQNKYEAALETLQRALLGFQKDSYHFGAAMCLYGLGKAYDGQRKHLQALDNYKQALELFDVIDNPIKENGVDLFAFLAFDQSNGKAETLRSIGRTYLEAGQYEQALDYFQKALIVNKEINYELGEARNLVEIGMAFMRSSRYQKALDSFQQAIVISKKAGNRDIESDALNGIGIVYTVLGQYEKALDFLQQSGEIIKYAEGQYKSSATLLAIGDVYRKQGQYQKALYFLGKALITSREEKDRDLESNILDRFGIVYENMGQFQESLNYHLQALMIHRQIGNRYSEGYTLQNIGIVYDHLNRPQEAISYYTQALTISQELGDYSLEALVLSNRGNTYTKMGAFADAEQDLFVSIEREELLRTGLIDQNKVSIFDTQIRTYLRLQHLLIIQDKVEAALEVAERGRARAFAELLAQRATGDNRHVEMPKSPTIEEIKQIARGHDAVLVEYSIVQEEMALYIWVIQPTGEVQFRRADIHIIFNSTQNPSISKVIQQTQESIGAVSSHQTSNSTYEPGDLVRFDDDEQNGLSDPWQVTKLDAENDTITVTHPQIRNGEKTIRQMRSIKKKAGSFRVTNENLHNFYQLLIAPIANLLPRESGSYLIFVPFGELLLIPFAALQDSEDTYLIEKYCISTVTSIHILGLTLERKKSQGDHGLLPTVIVGNPLMPTIPLTDPLQHLENLPEAEEEAKAIAALFGSQPIIGPAATKKSVVEQMLKAQLIHLATHGLLDDIKQLGFPGAIALAPSNEDDGFLTTSEIIDLSLHAQLAVLSACHTGGGQITGDGIVGLSRSLIVAGVSTVIVSLWAVASDAAAELMMEFYRYLLNNRNKAEALRHAMLKIMKKDGYEHPKDWAAFIIIGEASSDQSKRDETIVTSQSDIDHDQFARHLHSGLAYYQKGNFSKAIDEFKVAINLDPHFALAHSLLGTSLAEQQRFDEAIEAYQTAIELDPSLAAAHADLGALHFLRGELDEAVEAYQKAIQIDPQLAEVYSNLGNIYARRKEMNSAIASYKKAIDIYQKESVDIKELDEFSALFNKNYAIAYSNLGNAYAQQGLLGDAIEHYKKAINLGADNPFI